LINYPLIASLTVLTTLVAEVTSSFEREDFYVHGIFSALLGDSHKCGFDEGSFGVVKQGSLM